MLDLMHDGEPYGHLTAGGKPITVAELSRMVGTPRKTVEKALAELESRCVFSRTEAGVIFCRRMVRDEARRNVNARSGSLGGNPLLMARRDKGTLNHPDNQFHNHSVKPDPTAAVAVASASASAISKAPDDALSSAMEQFRKKFYDGDPARWDEVERQLLAESVPPARLDRTLREVMAMQVRVPKSAVVIVQKKLRDPPTDARGRTVTEAASAVRHEDDAGTAAWNQERHRSIEEWKSSHTEAAEEVERRVRGEVVTAVGTPGYAVEYRSRLTQALAAEAGVPDYDDWREARRNGCGQE